VLIQGGTTTSLYNYPSNSNKLSTVTQGGTTVRSFTHDGAGNVSADSRSGTAYSYRYNNRGRLDELSVASQVLADYTYDGLERLAVRATQNMTPSGTTHYVYDRAGHLLAEASSTGTTVREYVWLDDLPLAVVADVDTSTPKLWYVHADHLDRPIRMTDDTKAVVWDAVYQPFGAVYSITGTATNNLRFPGQYFLLEAGLHYNWHRHYDPTLGRYLQPDPLGFVDGPSVYAYVAGNPISRMDPSGLFLAPVHIGITTGALILMGDLWNFPSLPLDVAGVDFDWGSQSPENAYRHGMRKRCHWPNCGRSRTFV
jgi:RHS repeat-associated protein